MGALQGLRGIIILKAGVISKRGAQQVQTTLNPVNVIEICSASYASSGPSRTGVSSPFQVQAHSPAQGYEDAKLQTLKPCTLNPKP